MLRLPFISRRKIRIPPPAVLALFYLAFILFGAGLLMLPFSSRVPLSFSDALFTATSAVTVTGLVIVDTGTVFSPFGQAVILLLIQLGGLGLMTFAVLVLSMLGMPVGVSHTPYLREDLNQTSVPDLLRLVTVIFRVVLLAEIAGVLLLALVFVPEFGWLEGFWHALFHSVSAFNNAGFALFPDSLSRWATNPVMNVTVPVLFIIGGIGFSVLSDIYRVRRWQAFSLHTKLMLTGTAALILASVAAFAALEWSNPQTLGAFAGVADKLTVSWFQAVTTRTAGFNTADISAIYDSTALMFMVLMVIGAGSTSTAGGIKVTTFIVLLLAVVAFFKRRSNLRAFGRSLGLDEVLKVLALAMLGLMTVITGLFVITLTNEGRFLDLAFEVASAFGTVGLSRGATGELDGLGRAVIIVLMFVGRVGPLTLGFFLATRVPARIRYPAGRIYLG